MSTAKQQKSIQCVKINRQSTPCSIKWETAYSWWYLGQIWTRERNWTRILGGSNSLRHFVQGLPVARERFFHRVGRLDGWVGGLGPASWRWPCYPLMRVWLECSSVDRIYVGKFFWVGRIHWLPTQCYSWVGNCPLGSRAFGGCLCHLSDSKLQSHRSWQARSRTVQSRR